MSEEAERLNQALDRLLEGDAPEDGAGDEPLLRLAAGLRDALRPVPPAAEFRARLKAELLERYANNVRPFPVPAPVAPPRPSHWRRMRHAAVAAAAATAASLALIFGYDALHHSFEGSPPSTVSQHVNTLTPTPTAPPASPTPAGPKPRATRATPLRVQPGTGSNPVQPSHGTRSHHHVTPAPRPTATATGAAHVASVPEPTATDTPQPPDTATTPPDTATPLPATATLPPATATRPAPTATTPPTPTRTVPAATSTVPAPTGTRPVPTSTPAPRATATASGNVRALSSVTVPAPTATPVLPTSTPVPPATSTAAPTDTVSVPSATAMPTQPPATRTPAPTATTPPKPTATPVPPTATSAPPPPSATAAPRKTATAVPSDTPVGVLPTATPTIGAPPTQVIVAQSTATEQPRPTHAIMAAGGASPTPTATPAVQFPAPLPANAGAGSPLGNAAPYAPAATLRVTATLPSTPAQLPVFTPASGQGSAADILGALNLSPDRVTARDRGTATAPFHLNGRAYVATLVVRNYGYHLTVRLAGTTPTAPAEPPSFDVVGAAESFLDARGLAGTYASPEITQSGSAITVALTQQSNGYPLAGAQAKLTFDTNGVLHAADVRWVDTAAAPLVNSISPDAALHEIAAGHGLISPRGLTPDAASQVSGVWIIYVPVNGQDGTYYEPVYRFTCATGAGAQFEIFVPAIGAVYLG